MPGGLFSHLHHICTVVHDIDAAQRFDEVIGVGPWRPYPPLSESTALEVLDREALMGPCTG